MGECDVSVICGWVSIYLFLTLSCSKNSLKPTVLETLKQPGVRMFFKESKIWKVVSMKMWSNNAQFIPTVHISVCKSL